MRCQIVSLIKLTPSINVKEQNKRLCRVFIEGGSVKMKWLMLLFAGIFEIVWAVAMKYSNGFSVLLPSIITAVAYILSAVFLAFALKYLPLGMAYVMWVAFGIIGTTILGVLLFSEKLTVLQIISIILIIVGVIGLKLFAKQ